MKLSNTLAPKFSVAPMMDYTDRHCRYFLRLFAPDVRLYTEMITTQALIRGNTELLLAYHPAEKYLALQLGGSDPQQLAYCARLGEDAGYDEINLNVGCPSSRVKSGRFGACLMLEKETVAEGVAAMRAAVAVPVTVKCRIGVDEQDSYAALYEFVRCIANAGCKTVIIHARKAWLSGLSPKENREIPPLRYDIVRAIKKDFPALTIILNGGIKTLSDIAAELPYVDGMMIGRAAYANPYLLADIQAKYFGNTITLDRQTIVQQILAYASQQLQNGVKLHSITRHILGLYQGQRGAAVWRRHLSHHSFTKCANIAVIEQAANLVNTLGV